jgi:hypothetical protein
MASQAYQSDGAIIIWCDETEGSNADDFSHTMPEIVISPLAKGNGYASPLNYTHSSDLKTMQEIFQVGPLLGDAASPGTLDLADMFVDSAIPNTLPIVGDYNHDRVVDASDYTVWRDELGQTGYGLAADGDLNGIVDAADYDVWKSAFGTGGGGSAARAVPEPRTWALLILSTVGLSFRRYSRSRYNFYGA